MAGVPSYVMSSHGIIQPNPALVEPGTAGAGARHVLGHEMGLGAACHVCGDTCPGFQVTADVACTLDCQWGFGKCHSQSQSPEKTPTDTPVSSVPLLAQALHSLRLRRGGPRHRGRGRLHKLLRGQNLTEVRPRSGSYH